MFLLTLMLAPVAPTALTERHQQDIACVVEIAVVADAQKRGVAGGVDVRENGRRWAGIVGDRIVFETGQPRELVAVAMQEVAKASGGKAPNPANVDACTRRMMGDLALTDAASQPLPKPVKAR